RQMRARACDRFVIARRDLLEWSAPSPELYNTPIAMAAIAKATRTPRRVKPFCLRCFTAIAEARVVGALPVPVPPASGAIIAFGSVVGPGTPGGAKCALHSPPI